MSAIDISQVPLRNQPVSASVIERLLDEGLISLVAASGLLPPTRDGKRVSTASIFRWIRHGKNGVKLEGCRLNGSGLWTTKAALARFSAALTARDAA